MKEDKETINSLWDDCSETAGKVNSWTAIQYRQMYNGCVGMTADFVNKNYWVSPKLAKFSWLTVKRTLSDMRWSQRSVSRVMYYVAMFFQ